MAHILKKKSIILILISLVILGVFFAVDNNERFYKETIIKVTSVSVDSTYERIGTNGRPEKITVQNITAVIRNGDNKGEQVTFKKEYSESLILSSRYFRGDKLFADVNGQNGDFEVTVTNEKRDSSIVLLLGIFVLLVVMVAKRACIFILLSLAVNAAMLWVSIKNVNIGILTDWFWIVLCVLFVFITLIFVCGRNVKTVYTFVSSLVTVSVIVLIYWLTVYGDSSLSYESIEYTLANMPLAKIYMISVIFGSLGAIMDIAVTITSSAFEIARDNDTITYAEYFNSLREIGYDILSTMINVLFFSYISGMLPSAVLMLCNGVSIDAIFKTEMIFEVIRFLIGSIGIVLAIPISIIFALIMLKRKRKKV